jgi:hypothetical protein
MVLINGSSDEEDQLSDFINGNCVNTRSSYYQRPCCKLCEAWAAPAGSARSSETSDSESLRTYGTDQV